MQTDSFITLDRGKESRKGGGGGVIGRHNNILETDGFQARMCLS